MLELRPKTNYSMLYKDYQFLLGTTLTEATNAISKFDSNPTIYWVTRLARQT